MVPVKRGIYQLHDNCASRRAMLTSARQKLSSVKTRLINQDNVCAHLQTLILFLAWKCHFPYSYFFKGNKATVLQMARWKGIAINRVEHTFISPYDLKIHDYSFGKNERKRGMERSYP